MNIVEIHPKVKELQLRAASVNTSNLSVDNKGQLVEGDDNVIKGYLCVWGVRDTYGTAFVKGCFAKSIKERGPKSDSKYKIVGLWQHRMDDPIGRFKVLKEDDYGLYFELVLDDFDAVPSAKRAASQVKSGTINQFSIGFGYIWDKVEYDEPNDTVLILECELWEGSVVTRGSNHETYAFRSPDEYENAKMMLDAETEDFIKTIPRNKQLELRQLLTRHTSLVKAEPQELRQPALPKEKTEPTPDAKELNISELLKAF
jgi:HK97 family phage prohead protease